MIPIYILHENSENSKAFRSMMHLSISQNTGFQHFFFDFRYTPFAYLAYLQCKIHIILHFVQLEDVLGFITAELRLFRLYILD